MCVLNFWTEGARILQSHYHWWWIMDFRVWPRDETPKLGVGHCKLSPSQESESKQIQNQIDAHLFFLTVRRSSTRNLCHQDKLSIFLSGSPWKTQEKGGTCATRHRTHTDAAPRCPMSHGSPHQWIFARKKHSCGSSAPLFARSQSLWILFIPPAQKPLERAPFWYFGYYPEERNRRAERYSNRSLPALLQTMETTPPSLCSCPRELFHRG